LIDASFDDDGEAIARAMLRSVHFSANAMRTHLFNGTAPAYAPTMSKPDRFKEEISWLKALGTVLLAGLTSLLVWLVQNYEVTTRVVFLLSLFGLSGLAISIVAILFRLYRCFKILETL
jgi:hypothetical protein